MNIRLANESDMKVILGIIKQAQDYFKENGIDQWQNNYPNEEVIKVDIKNGVSYVIIDNDKIIATFMHAIEEDLAYKRIYDGGWINSGKYAVIHRVAVDNGYKGKGIIASVVDFATEIVLKNNIESIRIDTHEDNKSMQKALEKNGFKTCGTIYLLDGAKRIGFEKILTNKLFI